MSQLEFEQSENDNSRVELYMFETDDGKHRYAYTTDRLGRVFMGFEYVPETIKRGEIKQQAGDSGAQKLEITVPFNNPVAVLHVPYLPPRPVKVTIYSYQRNDPASEVVQGFTGYVTGFTQKGVDALLECSQILDAFSQVVPWATFKSDCVWALYGIGCGVDKAAFKVDVPNVSSVVGERITSGTFATYPDGWFTNGFAMNPATGEQRFITKHDASQATIFLSYPFIGYTGGPLITYAGCDRRRDTCHEKFNNKINYLGFDHTPDYNVFQKGVR